MKRKIFLVVFILLLFSVSVYVGDFSITLSYVSVSGGQNSKLSQIGAADSLYLMGEWSF